MGVPLKNLKLQIIHNPSGITAEEIRGRLTYFSLSLRFLYISQIDKIRGFILG